MGIIVDFAARTVAGFGYGGWDEVVNIISVGDVTIAFGGPSQRKDSAWLVLGTIDRITGSVDATASMWSPQRGSVARHYSLKCARGQQKF
jgi:hypothetical protein